MAWGGGMRAMRVEERELAAYIYSCRFAAVRVSSTRVVYVT